MTLKPAKIYTHSIIFQVIDFSVTFSFFVHVSFFYFQLFSNFLSLLIFGKCSSSYFVHTPDHGRPCSTTTRAASHFSSYTSCKRKIPENIILSKNMRKSIFNPKWKRKEVPKIPKCHSHNHMTQYSILRITIRKRVLPR